MKLVCISDNHCLYPDLPEGNILIIAGDFTYLGKPNEIQENQKWLDSLKFKHIVAVAGNHDWGFHSGTFKGVTLLFDEEITVEGLRIYGTPYTPIFYNWDFMEEEEALVRRFAKIPEGLDILITHGPPRGILDMNKAGEHCGSTALRDRLLNMKSPPAKHIFGHLHREYKNNHICYNGTDFYNASITNERYRFVNKPIEIR